MEFDLIDAIRARTESARGDVALGIGDDAALLRVPDGCELVVCTDTMVAGVHFLADTAPEDLGWKSLAVNLSDLAAMGAEPAWALLALTLPEADDDFVDRFADGFAELAGKHRLALVGGDTTQGPLSITVTVLGTVPRGQALTRAGARAGDAVFVTGTLGDAAGALQWSRAPGSIAHHPFPSPQGGEGNARSRAPRDGAMVESGTRDSELEPSRNELLQRMHRPEPRIAAGLALRGVASACIDISDGLLADLGHVCKASGVGAEIGIEDLPVSSALAATFAPEDCRKLALTGGDDYELCFSVPEDRAAEIQDLFAGAGCTVTRIGRMCEAARIRVTDAHGNIVESAHAGWEHFSR